MEVKEASIKDNNQRDVLLKLFNVHVPSGDRAWREHRHSQFEIVLFKSGSGKYTTANAVYSIQKGDVFVFSSNEEHCITKIDDREEMILMNLHFEPRYFWGTGNDSFSDSNLFFSHQKTFQNRLNRGDDAAKIIARLLLEIEKEFLEKPPEFRISVRAKVIEILLTLIRQTNYYAPGQKGTGANILPVKNAIEYIHSHLTEPLKLADIAANANLSASYFSTVFKTVIGTGVWDYITQKRLEKAMRMLETDSSTTMLEIALQCGFNNTANFNKAFRAHIGKTPREYRAIGKSALY